MKEILTKLLTIKSIVTLLLTVLFSILSVQGKLTTEVVTTYTTVIAFYFGTQTEKKG